MPLTGLFTLLPLACSGPGAAEFMEESVWIGYFTAAIAAVYVVALIYDALQNNRLPWPLMLAATLLLAHPAWTISAYSGDCGYTKRYGSYIFTAAFTVLFATRIRGRRE